jgi:hypothetical protein
LVDLAIKDFDKQPISGMRGHQICLGSEKLVRKRVAIVDQIETEVYILFSAAYESYEFRASYFTSKISKFNEMKNSPTLQKIMGEKNIMKKLQEVLITIGLKLGTPKFIKIMINYEIKNSYGIFNFEMVIEEEQRF